MEAITENEIKKAMEASRENITHAIVEHLKERMIHDIRYSSNDVVEKEIKSFIDAEIVPEIRKSLHENKKIILEQLNTAAVAIGTEVAKGLITKAVSNMTGYRGMKFLRN